VGFVAFRFVTVSVVFDFVRFSRRAVDNMGDVVIRFPIATDLHDNGRAIFLLEPGKRSGDKIAHSHLGLEGRRRIFRGRGSASREGGVEFSVGVGAHPERVAWLFDGAIVAADIDAMMSGLYPKEEDC